MGTNNTKCSRCEGTGCYVGRIEGECFKCNGTGRYTPGPKYTAEVMGSEAAASHVSKEAAWAFAAAAGPEAVVRIWAHAYTGPKVVWSQGEWAEPVRESRRARRARLAAEKGVK